MKSYHLLFVFLLSVQFSAGQTRARVTGARLKSILSSVSPAEWIRDSLGGNGYRMTYFGQFEGAEMDSTTSELVMEALGKPSVIQEITEGRERQPIFQYLYYLQDIEIYRRKPIFEHPYIVFKFDRRSGVIMGIEKDYLCF